MTMKVCLVTAGHFFVRKEGMDLICESGAFLSLWLWWRGPYYEVAEWILATTRLSVYSIHLLHNLFYISSGSRPFASAVEEFRSKI